MKPLGVSLRIQEGLPVLRCAQPTKAEDAVYEAVEQAIEQGWTPRRFIAEARQAWQEFRNEAMKTEMKEFP